MRIRLKVCCISSHDEVNCAVQLGASALGFVSHMPSGPGVVSDEQISAMVSAVPAAVSRFLLSSRTAADDVIEHVLAARVDTLQLVDEVPPEVYTALRQRAPHVRIVQVVHMNGAHVLDQALSIAGSVDALLLDSGRPNATRRELGGTGRVHDWKVSRRVVESTQKPVFLAGGLTPENVARAIDVVGPFGVDVCSGVRSGGRLDARKLEALVAAIARAGLEYAHAN